MSFDDGIHCNHMPASTGSRHWTREWHPLVTLNSLAVAIILLVLFNSSQFQAMELASTDLLSYSAADQTNGELQRIIVHHHSGDVYVGGTNILLRLHGTNLTLLEQPIVTGPILDSGRCSPAAFGCSVQRELTDVQSKLLVVDYELNVLLHCGSTRQGMCDVSLLDDCSRRWTVGDETDVTNYIAGKQSVSGFFARGPWLSRNQALYTAATYDDRPLALTAPQVASRRLIREAGRYSFKMTYSDADRRTGVYFTDAAKKSYYVDYVYGFSHGNFSYFVTTQKLAPQSHEIESRLVRVHHDDTAFFSYAEVPLKCQQGMNTIFNLASAAQLSRSSDAAENIDLDESRDDSDELDPDYRGGVASLYVTFGRTVLGGSSVIDESKGSALCAFPMKAVVEAFTDAIEDCFERESNARRVTWIVDGARCQRAKISIDNNFAGNAINSYIEGALAIPGHFIQHSKSQITSLAVTVQNDVVVAILGTSEGKISKLKLSNSIAELLYTTSITSDLPAQHRSVSRSVTFDPNEKNLFLLTGRKITKFPVGSCSVYGDCQSCMSSGADPLECGWCAGVCSLREECTANFQRDRCPPSIDDFEPKYGPLEGGTFINITGKNFGSSTSGSGSSLTILIGLEVCEIVSWRNEQLVCLTKAVTSGIKNVIRVSVSDKTKLATGYIIEGEAYSYGEMFEYVKPEVKSLSPTYGPMIGGTNITFHGRYLSAGSRTFIKIGTVDCTIYVKSFDHLSCTTGRHQGPPYSTNAAHFTIDDAVLTLNSSITFRYMPNPVIKHIEPSSGTIGGGRELTVVGDFLDAVFNPQMIVIITTPISGKVVSLSQNCAIRTRQKMVCITPSITSVIDTTQISSKSPLLTHLSFVMDGAINTTGFPTLQRAVSQFFYYPEPKFKPFSGERRERIINSDTNVLEVDGESLNMAYDESDVTVTIDGDSKCGVQELTQTRLVCKLPTLEPTTTNAHKVVVKMGNTSHDIGYLVLNAPPKNLSSPSYLWLAVVIAIGLLLIIILLTVLWRCKASQRKKQSNMIVTYRSRVEDGDAESSFSVADSARTRDQYHNDYYSMATATTANKKAVLVEGGYVSEETMQLLRDEEILIARDFLEFGEVIGQGHFGRVYQGHLNYPGKPDPISVAVKTLNTKDPITDETVGDFLNEGLMMKDFHHVNVISLIGVCFEDDGVPVVIIPFMRHGDLLSYIRNENNSPTVKDLLNFGIQIAEGMQYLSELKFVHRDLAARNCMLDDGDTVKVADFGLSRDVYESAYYCSENKKTKLPVKWMAIESLEKGQYSIKSDVWSYGVVLWELMTRGINPYPEVDNWDIVKYLTSGRRMPQPSYCPSELYEIMLNCWNEDSHKRPVFAELVDSVRGVVKVMERRSQHKKHVGLDVTYINYPQPAVASCTSLNDGASSAGLTLDRNDDGQVTASVVV